jgi:hypothetical protein
MECNAGSLGKALQTVRHHLTAQLAEPLAFKTELDDAIGTVREIDDGAGEGFVERRVGVSEASYAGERAEGLVEGVTKSNADVFGCVVVIDCLVVRRNTTVGEGNRGKQD